MHLNSHTLFTLNEQINQVNKIMINRLLFNDMVDIYFCLPNSSETHLRDIARIHASHMFLIGVLSL